MPVIGGINVPDSVFAPQAATTPDARPTLGGIFQDAAQQANRQLRFGLPAEYYALKGDQASADAETAQLNSYAQPTRSAATIDDVMAGKVGVGRAALENL